MSEFPILNKLGAEARLGDVVVWARRVVNVVNGALGGKLNVTGSVTLVSATTQTILADPRLGLDSAVLFDPVTANAAAELAAGTFYCLNTGRMNGQWTLTHANGASGDRTFRYVILG